MTEAALFSLLDDPSQAPLVVTGNPRAARILRIHHGLWQQQRKKTAWHTPQILTWDAWLGEIWDGLLMSGTAQEGLLSPAQEHHLWQQVILAKNEIKDRIWYSGSLAELAQTVLQGMEQYAISIPRMEQAAAGKDAVTFLRWLRAFQNQCARQGFICPSALARCLTEKLELSEIPLPRQILLVGFDRVTPDQQKLLERLQAKGCDPSLLWLVPAHPSETAPVIIAADTAEEEILSAACWIRRRLLKDPDQRIGVLAPSITDSRYSIDRIFRSVLAPSTFNLLAATHQLPYEFTLGVPLGRMPQVQAALLLLRWLIEPIGFDDASFLLVSGHIGTGSTNARARLDAALRNDPQLLNLEPDFLWLMRRLRECKDSEIAPFRECMSLAATVARSAGILSQTSSNIKPRPHAEWREMIDQLLQAAGWNLLLAKSSAEFQLLERWNRLLDEVSMLDALADSVSFPGMLEMIAQTASRALYAQETQNAPVQIMGIAESSGLTFDAVWFLQASANMWPPKGRVQPWIPWPLQRAAEMPYANLQADYDHARNVTNRVLSASKEVVFSFSLEDIAEEISSARKPSMQVRISPILQDLFPGKIPLQARKWLPEIALHSQMREADKTIPMASELSVPFRNTRIQHGVSFLKQQAACPFKAFAELRLAAMPLEHPSIGLTASAQGSAMHEVLRTFWSQVRDQVSLRALSREQRVEILDTHIQHALGRLPALGAFEKSLLSTEAERLRTRLLAWLEVEELRPDFSVMDGEKTMQDAWIGDLQFDCRIDRIDKVGNGLALIDYKTGAAKASACDGDRPDEPQLPTYAILLRDQVSPDEPLRGVAIASLQAKEVGFKIVYALPHTFSKTDSVDSKVRTPILNTEKEFLEQLDIWEQTLRHLADGFRSGIATVDPKLSGTTCSFCAQSLLCRIAETQLPADDPEEQDGSIGNEL